MQLQAQIKIKTFDKCICFENGNICALFRHEWRGILFHEIMKA